MAGAKIAELRAFLSTLGPVAHNLVTLGLIGRSIEDALNQFHYENHLQVLVSAQGLARLPDDILSIIFHEASLAETRKKWKTSLAVSQICRRLRHVALCTPSLWCCMALTMPKDMLITFMQRSGNVGLHICLSDSGTGLGSSPELFGRDIVEDLWSVIRVGVDRITRMDVKLIILSPEHSPSSRLLEVMSNHRFSGLEELRVCFGNDSREPGEDTSSSVDQFLRGDIFLPSLRHVAIASKGQFPLPLHRGITTLVFELLQDFDSVRLDGLLSLLSTSNSLEHLTIIYREGLFKSTAAVTRVEVPSVTTFVLIVEELCTCCREDTTFRAFVRACCFPSMSHLFVTASCVSHSPTPYSSPYSSPSYPSPYSHYSSHFSLPDDEQINGTYSQHASHNGNEQIDRSSIVEGDSPYASPYSSHISPQEDGWFDCASFIEDIFEGRDTYPALLLVELEFSSSPEDQGLPYFTIPLEAYAPNLQHFAIAAGKLSSLWRVTLPPLRVLRVEGCSFIDLLWISQYVDGMIQCGMLDQFKRLCVSGNQANMNLLYPGQLQFQPSLKHLEGRIDIRVVNYDSPFTSKHARTDLCPS